MPDSELYEFGPFRLNAREWRLERDGEPISLQPKVLRTLLYLVRRAGQVVTKRELLHDLWPSVVVTENVLTRCVKELRRALDDDPRDARFIRTAPRIGYAFIADVRRLADRRTAHHVTTIAVLPLRALVANEDDESLGLGLADTLIARLSAIRHVIVRPLSAVQRCVQADWDPIAVGRDQGVDAVVEGSLQRGANRLRLTVRVLRVSDASALLAESFDEALDDVFAMQDAVCRRVVDALSLELTSDEVKRLAHADTRSLEAYRLYLLGRLNASRRTPDGDLRAIERFEQAVERDPGYAVAWAGLADAYDSLGTLETHGGHFESARRAAMRALEIEPELVPALTCLGKIAWELDWSWNTAEELLTRAVRNGPGDADAHIAFSDYCAYQSRHEEAIDAAARAVEIDPSSTWANALLAQALHMSDLHRDAIAQARKTLELDPRFAFTYLFLGLSEMMVHRWSDGIASLSRARELSGRSDFTGALGWALARAGRRSEALTLVHELEALDIRQSVIPLALVYAGLGERERSLDLFEQAARLRDWHVLLLHNDPILRDLRTHPRATCLLANLRLPVAREPGRIASGGSEPSRDADQ